MIEVRRIFTHQCKGKVYEEIKFREIDSEVRNKDQSVRSSWRITAPEDWSVNAVDVMAGKYCRKAGVPHDVIKVEERVSGTGELIPRELWRSIPAGGAVYGGEHDVRQVIDRVAGAWAYWGMHFGYFDSTNALAFFDELRYMMIRQMLAPASPQWFNTGLYWAYGIMGQASGLWHVNPVEFTDEEPAKPISSPTSYVRPMVHACFIQSVEDDLVNPGGIMDLVTRESRVFKFGGGSGSNFSNLRGKEEPLSGGGKSSGVMSFLRVNDVAAGAIKSGGVTRRAAKMVVLDVDHPDIMDFINWKVEEENKVACMAAGSRLIHQHIEAMREEFNKTKSVKKSKKLALRAGVPAQIVQRYEALFEQGYTTNDMPLLTTDFESEAYNTVSGQNANNTVRVTNEFMRKATVISAGGVEPFTLRYRRNLEPAREVDAKQVWETLNLASWKSADPGLHFADTINDWNLCPNDGEIVASNPCSEYFWLNNTGCNLASIRLTKFADGKRFGIDYEKYKHAIELLTTVLDITVSMAAYPSKEIAEGSYKYRTLGLGYCDLGALLMKWGVAYDSHEGRAAAGAITALMHFYAMRQSSILAAELSPFPRWNDNRDAGLRVVNNHVAATGSKCFAYTGDLKIKPPMLNIASVSQFLDGYHYLSLLVDTARAVAEDAWVTVQAHGLRNAQLTLLAPTGTIGILLDCDTTGVEPDFALVKFKKLAGGGYMKIVNQSLEPALMRLGYTQAQASHIKNHVTGFGNLVADEFYSAYELYMSERKTKVDRVNLDNVFHLSHIGVPKDFPDFQRWNQLVCGSGTVEGSGIKDEHLSVFDCANKCGDGKRFLSYLAHIQMMAAVQPFLSGAISKTINMPNDATIDLVRSANVLSWEYSLKANAQYRDGCKLSQPLNSSADEDAITAVDSVNTITEKLARGIRRSLKAKRYGYTRKLRVSNHKFYMRTGEYEDGTLGEIFLDSNREGAFAKGVLNSLAIAVSIGLQYGVPLGEYVDAFTFSRFEPNGHIEGHERLKVATSLLDVVFRDVAIHYLGRDELAQDNPAEETAASQEVKTDDRASLLALAKRMGYEGDACTICKNLTLVRRGKCLTCLTCANTTGCD